MMCSVFVFQAEDGIRCLVRSRGLGDVYKRQLWEEAVYDADGQLRTVTLGDYLVPSAMETPNFEPVSYTHLTLPTSDLV